MAATFRFGKLQIYGLVLLQAIVVSALTAVWWHLKGSREGLSVLAGGLVCLLPSAYFAHWVFAKGNAHDAKKIIRRFYWGEVIKLVLIGILFLICIKWVPIIQLPFFIGFIGALLAIWLAPLFYLLQKQVGK